MYRITNAYLILFILFFTAQVKAQNNYFEKALDSFETGKLEAAKEYLDLEIGENKRNAFAYFYRANINILHNNTTKAFEDITLALANFEKNEKNWKAASYVIRGKLHLEKEQIKKSISDFKAAIDIGLTDYEFYIYRNLIYQKHLSNLLVEVPMFTISINEKELYKLNNYSDNFITAKKYSKAKKVLDLLINLNFKDADRFYNRAKLMHVAENYNQAILDIIESFRLNQDNSKVQELVVSYSKKNYMLAINQLSEILAKNPKSILLHYLMAQVYDKNNLFAEAIPEYTLGLELIKVEYRPWLLQYRARAFKKIGMFDRSIEDFSLAIQMDPNDAYSFSTRADTYTLIEKYDLAIEGYSKAIELKPNQAFNYLRRGRAKEKFLKNYEAALEDYNKAIALDSNYYYNYFKRSQLYLFTYKDTLKAAYDLNKVIALDSVYDNDGMHKPFALLLLNKTDEAKKVISTMLKKYPSGPNNYTAACFYALINKKDKALKHLNIALEKGYRELKHIDGDDYMDNIRHTAGYIETMSKWKKLEDETARLLNIYLIEHNFLKE